MKCNDCETKLTEQEKEFGLCGICEGKRSKKKEEDYQKEQVSEEMSKTNNADWHKEFSKKGGSAKSEKKTAACRKNARKPRKKKMPEYDTVTLLKLAHLELVTSYGVIGGDEIKRDGLHINDIPFVDVIKHHLEKL